MPVPGAPLLRRTAAHARHSTSLRLTLSYSAWNLRPGSALAARYSACCKARTGSPATGDPLRGGTSTDGTHRALLHNTAHRRSSGPSPHRRLCCPPGSTGTTAASDAHPASTPLPGSAGYRTPRSDDMIRRSPGREGLPSSRRHPRYVPRPLRRGVPHGCASRLCAASMAFAPISRGPALPLPAQGRLSNDAAGFASCYGPHRRSPIQGF